MDLSNLTFDELLDAIRSDSGYQTAQAKKINTQKAAVQETKAEETPKETPEAEPAITITADTSSETLIPEAEEEITAEETDTYEEVVIENPVEVNDKAVEILSACETVTEDTYSYEEIVIENPIEVNDKTVEVLSAAESAAEKAVAEIAAEADEKPAETLCEDDDTVVYEAPKPDTSQIFTPPATPLSLFETDIPEEEELPVWRMPDFTAQAYKPIALADDEPTAEPEPVAVLSEEEIIYTPPAVPEPIEIIQPEEPAEEPVKIYTPPKPETVIFGNFNIEADIASLFPDITSDDFEPVRTDNIEKTKVIPPLSQPAAQTQPEPSFEKTRAIPTRADDKTRKIPNQTDDKTKPTATVSDDKTKAINFDDVFERPGIVTTSNAYEKTSDLNALPHILPADELIDSEPKKFVRTGEIPKIAYTPKAPVVRHEEDEQMVLPGFFDKEEIIRVDEDVVEEELKRTRSRKVDSFRLEGAEIDEAVMSDEVSQELAQGNTDTKKRRFSTTKTRHRLTKQRVEFTRPSDGKAVHGFISSKQLMAIIGAAVSGICSLLLLITTAVPSIAESINSGSGSGEISSTHIISLVALLVAIGGALPGCISGITCFFNGAGKPNSQTPVIIAAATALIQTVVVIASGDSEKYPLFALAATFLLCCCSIGNILIYTRTKANFAFLYKQGRDGLYSARSIDNAADANRVSQNVVMGNADIRYSGKLKFADRFMAYSLSSDSADDLCAKLVPILAAVSLVIAVIGGIITKSFAGAVTIFSGTICMGAPACALIAANFPLLLENKKLREDGAMISGYAAAFEYESTNAVAIDASELFPGENCNIHGMKTFNGVRVDDAVLTAASMLIAAGGPISSLFENVIMEHNELLLKVDELKYEERLGLTGWIRNRRIFVGNRKLLENHNIEIPMSIDESKYVGGDRQIIYLADAGKIAAFFVVSYGRNKKIAEYLRRIENNGINILVRTTDSNINEKFIAARFDLPLNSVKVVSNTAGDVLKNYAGQTVTREGAKLIHNGTAAAFLHAVSSASKLCAIAGKISTLQTFCMAAGLLLTILIMIFSGPLSLTALPVCISQFVWLAIAAILPLFEKD